MKWSRNAVRDMGKEELERARLCICMSMMMKTVVATARTSSVYGL